MSYEMYTETENYSLAKWAFTTLTRHICFTCRWWALPWVQYSSYITLEFLTSSRACLSVHWCVEGGLVVRVATSSGGQPGGHPSVQGHTREVRMKLGLFIFCNLFSLLFTYSFQPCVLSHSFLPIQYPCPLHQHRSCQMLSVHPCQSITQIPLQPTF